MHALLPLGAAMLGVMQRRVPRFVAGHPWPNLWLEQTIRFADAFFPNRCILHEFFLS
jgi:hypothetical protein